MEKLTLKEIAGYLAHKLELQYVHSITQRKRTAFLTSLGVNEIETTYKRKVNGCSGDLISWEGHNSVHEMKVKPILHSLEMLTKTIVHNGVEIIPLIELEKNFNHFDFQYTDDFELLLKIKPKIEYPNHYFMADDVNRINQMLCEWHIDYQNLIGRGKAIDKSTLNSK